MSNWCDVEAHLVRAQYGEIEISPGQDWLIIKRWPLPNGWNKTGTSVLVLIPPGYQVTPPDNFYADDDLRLEGGSQPGNTSLSVMQAGRPWLQFSYHVEPSDWRPNANVLRGHNLLTFLNGVASRLLEPN